MRKRLIVLAWIHIVIGGLGLGVFSLLVGSAAMARDPAYGDTLMLFSGLIIGLSVLYFAPMFFGGVGLLMRKPWARWLLWTEAAILALAIPVGTLLAGYSLWALITTTEVTTDGIARVERIIRNSLRNIVLILIALFILGVIVGVGYLFRDVIDPPKEQILTPMPEMPDFKPPEFKTPEFNVPERPDAPE